MMDPEVYICDGPELQKYFERQEQEQFRGSARVKESAWLRAVFSINCRNLNKISGCRYRGDSRRFLRAPPSRVQPVSPCLANAATRALWVGDPPRVGTCYPALAGEASGVLSHPVSHSKPLLKQNRNNSRSFQNLSEIS